MFYPFKRAAGLPEVSRSECRSPCAGVLLLQPPAHLLKDMAPAATLFPTSYKATPQLGHSCEPINTPSSSPSEERNHVTPWSPGPFQLQAHTLPAFNQTPPENGALDHSKAHCLSPGSQAPRPCRLPPSTDPFTAGVARPSSSRGSTLSIPTTAKRLPNLHTWPQLRLEPRLEFPLVSKHLHADD